MPGGPGGRGGEDGERFVLRRMEADSLQRERERELIQSESDRMSDWVKPAAPGSLAAAPADV